MDAKITKKRLSRMLSYDWIKIIAVVAAAILGWSLIFTTTATRITPAQQFTVFNHTNNVSFGQTRFHDYYNRILDKDVFSYEVLETNVNDLTIANEYAGTLLETRVATNEGDVMFISNENDPSTSYKDETTGETKYKMTYMQSFTSAWYAYIADLQSETGFFKSMESYLGEYYGDWTDATTLDRQKAEDHFRARIKKNKDKRFKKKTQIEQGIADEIERLEKYRTALEDFYSYVDEGYVSITTVEVPSPYEENATLTRHAINLCPNVDTMGSLKDYVCYPKTYVDENGKEQVKQTAENMHVMLFNMPGVEKGFAYESLLFINDLIQNCCTELKK